MYKEAEYSQTSQHSGQPTGAWGSYIKNILPNLHLRVV